MKPFQVYLLRVAAVALGVGLTAVLGAWLWIGASVGTLAVLGGCVAAFTFLIHGTQTASGERVMIGLICFGPGCLFVKHLPPGTLPTAICALVVYGIGAVWEEVTRKGEP